jgi:hypothetical protein
MAISITKICLALFVIATLPNMVMVLVCTAQPRVPTISQVKDDLLIHGSNLDKEFIQNQDSAQFEYFSLPGYYLVHLGFRDLFSEGFMKVSEVCVYKLVNGYWAFKTIIPYNKGIRLIDSANGIFLTENEFCNMVGECSYYFEISKFRDNDLKLVVGFSGFDKRLNYDLRLVQRQEPAKSFLGDTVTNKKIIKNVTVSKNGIIAFDLEEQLGILKEVSGDSLNIASSYKISRNQKLP